MFTDRIHPVQGLERAIASGWNRLSPEMQNLAKDAALGTAVITVLGGLEAYRRRHSLGQDTSLKDTLSHAADPTNLPENIYHGSERAGNAIHSGVDRASDAAVGFIADARDKIHDWTERGVEAIRKRFGSKPPDKPQMDVVQRDATPDIPPAQIPADSQQFSLQHSSS